MKKSQYSDPVAFIIIVLTVLLFGVSLLVVRGFTHDLLLETGVFLVSAKLILMAKKNAETEFRLEQHLNDIKGLLQGITKQSSN